MKRCNHCHTSLNIIDNAVLWLCPVCGEYGRIKGFEPDENAS